jgi:hypothetical protein
MQTMRKKYKAHSNNPHVFIDKETRRSLTEEMNFWNFLIGQDYPSDDSYKSIADMEFDPAAPKMENKFNDEAKSSPFILERRAQVLSAIEELK